MEQKSLQRTDSWICEQTATSGRTHHATTNRHQQRGHRARLCNGRQQATHTNEGRHRLSQQTRIQNVPGQALDFCAAEFSHVAGWQRSQGWRLAAWVSLPVRSPYVACAAETGSYSMHRERQECQVRQQAEAAGHPEIVLEEVLHAPGVGLVGHDRETCGGKEILRDGPP